MAYSTQVVILAGGQGTRFWPISRMKQPKQFLSISSDGESLIAATARRVKSLYNGEGPWIVTNVMHRDLINQHVPKARLLCEPVGRNTAASIGLAALYISRIDPTNVMVVLPADHAVMDEEKLCETIRNGVALASDEELLVTIGIEPTYPHTGYGYIRRGARLAKSGFMVSRFFEKPSLERATQYVESGEFYWNSGMFVWRADAILTAIKEYMPELYTGLKTIEAAIGTARETAVIEEVFTALESLSVDFGILEHARNCAVVSAEKFGWNDVGSWDAWAEHFKKDEHGNLKHGDVLTVDCKDCVVYSDRRLTALVGAENMIVIDAGDALLVCPRSHVQDVRDVVQELKRLGRTELI